MSITDRSARGGALCLADSGSDLSAVCRSIAAISHARPTPAAAGFFAFCAKGLAPWPTGPEAGLRANVGQLWRTGSYSFAHASGDDESERIWSRKGSLWGTALPRALWSTTSRCCSAFSIAIRVYWPAPKRDVT